jgi:Xaa-Pro aminopeptidase
MRIPKSPPECFSSRRKKLLDAYPGPVTLGSGLSRIRNFEANRFPFRAESHFLYFVGRHIEGALLAFDRGEATLYVPRFDPAEALWRSVPSPDRLAGELGIPVRLRDDYEAPEDVATLAPDDTESAQWLEEMLGRIVEPGSAREAEGSDRALADVIIGLRLCHDEFAIEQMRAAAYVTTEAHLAGMRRTPTSKFERQVRATMEAVIAEHGMTTAYGSIVTTEGHVLHHDSSLLELGDGLLLCDVGAETPEGWASDVTRTWPCRGRFDGIQLELYEAVLAAQKAAIDLLRPAVRFRDVHRGAARTLVESLVAIGLLRGNAEELLERDVAALFFPHGIGHLLGLDVHDMEDLGDRAGYAPGRARSDRAAERFLRLDRDLLPGMVVTIEPGFYSIPSVLDDPDRLAPLHDAIDHRCLDRVRKSVSGIRIEDDVLVTEEGSLVLSATCPKEAKDVERVLAESL